MPSFKQKRRARCLNRIKSQITSYQ